MPRLRGLKLEEPEGDREDQRQPRIPMPRLRGLKPEYAVCSKLVLLVPVYPCPV